jgi:ribosomal protein S18 acetylase RimI-like enzyme
MGDLMFKHLLAVFFTAVSLLYGELHNFQLNSVSYEWEAEPNFSECKNVFMEAFIKCYDPIPLEVLNKPSRAAMIQWLSDTYDEIYTERSPSSRWLTAKIDERAVGCLVIDLEKYPEEIYLAQMAVDPAHQRQGIATTMILNFCEQLPETKRVVVITRKANSEAIELYHALGFADSSYIHEGYSAEIYCGFELQK